MRLRAWCCGAFLIASTGLSSQQPSDVTHVPTHVLRTRDGSTYVGRVLTNDGATIRFAMAGGTITVAAEDVRGLADITPDELHDGEYWFPDASRTRLLFGPTARTLNRGETEYENQGFAMQELSTGVTGRFTLGAGTSIIPFRGLTEWGYYVMPKVALVEGPALGVAAGALFGITGLQCETPPFVFLSPCGGQRGGVAYLAATHGVPDASVSLGAGWGYQGTAFASRPLFMLGGERRVSRRVALLTENYVGWVTTQDFLSGSFTPVSRLSTTTVASYGVRFLGERLSCDLVFINATTPVTTWTFPGTPYGALTLRF